jgi:glycosyltransferase involved in cell wall biosynthesis
MKSDACFVNHYAWSVFSGENVPGGHIGGEEVQHSLLATEFARRGLRTTLVTGDFGQGKDIQHQNVRVLATFNEKVGLPGVRMLHPRLSGLWRALGRADSRAYYVSCAGAVVGYVAAFCRTHGRRMVFRVASDADCKPNDLLVSTWKDRWLYAWGIRQADAILVQTDHQRELLRSNYGVDSRKVSMLVPMPDKVADDRQRDIDVLWLANLRSVKRPEWIPELAKLLPEVRFTMAGGPYGGQQALFDSIKGASVNLENLTFCGPVPFHETAALFARTRLFLNTSSLEGFPNTYLQAWANGAPVVATFDPDGVICQHTLGRATSSLEETASAIRHLLRDESGRCEASRRGRQFVEQHNGAGALRSYLEAMELSNEP